MSVRIVHILFIITGFSLLLLYGCAPRDVIKEEVDDEYSDNLHRYERDFDPSKYNTPFALQVDDKKEPSVESFQIPDIDEPEATTLTQGFRIQLYSTSDIEAAQEIQMVADSIFTDYWIYMVYEVPFYKVRLGDFQTRPHANRALAFVQREGFRDAWIVPDRVVKDPPVKIIEVEEEDDDIETREPEEFIRRN
jgi:hypothetical protein